MSLEQTANTTRVRVSRALSSPNWRLSFSLVFKNGWTGLAGVFYIAVVAIHAILTSYSTIANGEPGTERDRDELEHRFALLRPEILETLSKSSPLATLNLYLTCTLGRVGHPHPALSLAETYRDFSSLAALCHRDTVYPPHENPWITDIQRYIEKFKDDFAFELFRWYIQHGILTTACHVSHYAERLNRRAEDYVCTRRPL